MEERAALPVLMNDLLGADDPKTARLRMYPSPTGGFEPFFALFGTTANAVGMKSTDSVMTDTNLFTIVNKTKYPVMQYDLRTEPPKITNAMKLQYQLYSDKKYSEVTPRYAIFVITNDRNLSLLVTDTEHPMLLKWNELPKSLTETFTKVKTLTTTQ